MVVVREGFDQIDLIYDERSQLARMVISRMTVKTRGPVGALMVRFSGSTDQMNNFDIQ